MLTPEQVPEPQLVLTRSQAARRTRVLDAALQLASGGGYDAVQMRDVATTAHVALGTIYRYFRSKDELLAVALLEWARVIEREVSAEAPDGATVADRVVDVLRRACRAMERDPNLTAALVTAISSPDPAVSIWQGELTVILLQLLAAALEGVSVQERDGIARVLSWVWFGALLGWVNGWSNAGTVGDELETAARLLLR
jgi:TetR/AcrR family transcriptional regulator, cholesterol catabolism regulator